MKKIAYIELDTHAEIALQFYHLMEEIDSITVDYYFTDKISSRLLTIPKEKIIITDYKSVFGQLQAKDYDAVVIGTCHRYFNLFHRIAKQFSTGIIVHNVNFHHLNRRQLLCNVFKEDFLYRAKLLFKEGLFLAPKIKHKVNSTYVLSPELSNQKLLFLPLFYTDYNSENQTIDQLNVVIPGTVSQRRKDYFGAIEKLKNTTEPIKIIFLGKAKGEELQWLLNFEKTKPNNLELIYFTRRVSQEQYEYYLSKADVIWAPIQPTITFFSQTEIYGKTKISGSIGDAIKYGKMIMFPENYSTNLPFASNENNQPIDTQLNELKKERFNFQENYSKKSVAIQLENTLNQFFIENN